MLQKLNDQGETPSLNTFLKDGPRNINHSIPLQRTKYLLCIEPFCHVILSQSFRTTSGRYFFHLTIFVCHWNNTNYPELFASLGFHFLMSVTLVKCFHQRQFISSRETDSLETFFSISSQLGWNVSLMIQRNDNKQFHRREDSNLSILSLNGNFNVYGKSGKSTGLKSRDKYSVQP